MGQFSWIDCSNHRKRVIDDYPENSYVLVPEEFRDKYGEKITETYYEGYGDFGGHDIYDLVALWNRSYVSEHPEIYGKNDWFDIYTNPNNDEATLREKLLNNNYQLRYIGIDLACKDEDNASLSYPIKITLNKRVKYEDCGPSPSDPRQGW